MAEGSTTLRADAVVIGGGIVGLSTALALAARRQRVIVIAVRLPGEASPAAAGMLAPGLERTEGAAHRFGVAAREYYTEFLARLQRITDVEVPLYRGGILELVAESDADERDASALPDGAVWLSPNELRELEPEAGGASGAMLYRQDGAVDNVRLVDALWSAVSRSERITILGARATTLRLDTGPSVVTSAGETVTGDHVVLAAGSWVTAIGGLPRPLPVEPVRGQMIAFGSAPLRHVVYGAGAYLVPRIDGRTVVGSTMEHVGFDVSNTDEGVEALTAGARRACPALTHTPVVDAWSGLRPCTPDLLPIVGSDPDYPALLYGCGHSRNGILLGPLTGEVLARVATGESPGWELAPFSVTRFARDR